MNWNPRYVEYAKENGRTPEEQEIADSVEWPAGRMIGFILWCSKNRGTK